MEPKTVAPKTLTDNNTNKNDHNNNRNTKSRKEAENYLSILWDMWQDEPLHREMLCSSQRSKQATSLEEQTWTTGCTGQYNWLCPGYSPTS